MATLREFARRIRLVGDSVPAGANKLKIKAAVAIDQAVVLATPVGDPNLWVSQRSPPGYVGGRARANWVVGIGHANTQATDSTDWASTMETGQGQMKGAQSGQPIHITNNLPYIEPLNQGHSHQAPAGFIETAVQAGIDAVRGGKVLEP